MKTPSTKTWLALFVATNIVGFWAFALFSLFREAPASGKIADEAEILFGSATLVLTVLTIALAVLAVVGWYEIRNQALRLAESKMQELKDADILPFIKAEVKKAEEGFSESFSARLSAVTGSSFTQMYQIFKGEVNPAEMIDIAIKQNQKAVYGLERESERWWAATNNLAESYALKAAAKRASKEDAEKAIELAETLAKENRERPDSDFSDTWAKVLIEFSEHLPSPETKLSEVKKVLEVTVEDGCKTDREDARKNLKRLYEKAPCLFSHPPT